MGFGRGTALFGNCLEREGSRAGAGLQHTERERGAAEEPVHRSPVPGGKEASSGNKSGFFSYVQAWELGCMK